MAADTFEEARGGGVCNNRLNVELAGKLLERGVMLLVGTLLALPAAVEIVFVQRPPYSPQSPNDDGLTVP